MSPKTNTTHQNATIAWDVDEIFNRLGGTHGVLAHCARWSPLAIPPTYGTASVWKHRRSIPAEWLPVIVFGLLAGNIIPPDKWGLLFVERTPAVPSLEELGL